MTIFLDKKEYAKELVNTIHIITQQPEIIRKKPETEAFLKELKNEFKNFTGIRYSNSAMRKLELKYQPT